MPEGQAIAITSSCVAQLLFLAMRANRDIHTAVAFLTTCVKDPDEDDWERLKRVIKYLNGTKHLKPTLSIDNIGILKWYIDSSYAIHGDCRGHIRALLMMGKGAITSFSRKQKLNRRSST